VKAAYCTDRHFVLASDGSVPAAYNSSTGALAGIPRPPGLNTPGSSYDTQCVTRSYVTQAFAFKVWLEPTALPQGAASNNLGAFLSTDDYLTGVGLPKSGPTSFSVGGQPIFPPYNDRSVLTWQSCEMDRCNNHVGQGGDLHLHGDPFGANCLYSAADYINGTATHPPLIGWAMDGFELYGRYLSASAPGASVALDECSGHDHGDGSGYHYHSQVIQFTTPSGVPGVAAGLSYVGYIAGPYKCWRGDIAKQSPLFWEANSGPTHTTGYGSGSQYQSLRQRGDYADLMPCCGTSTYYAVSGVTINGVVGSSVAATGAYALGSGVFAAGSSDYTLAASATPAPSSSTAPLAVAAAPVAVPVVAIAAGVGGGVGGILLIGAVLLAVRHIRDRRAAAAPISSSTPTADAKKPSPGNVVTGKTGESIAAAVATGKSVHVSAKA
jgi:hypothetical protein